MSLKKNSRGSEPGPGKSENPNGGKDDFRKAGATIAVKSFLQKSSAWTI